MFVTMNRVSHRDGTDGLAGQPHIKICFKSIGYCVKTGKIDSLKFICAYPELFT